jgi:hypothetical protein
MKNQGAGIRLILFCGALALVGCSSGEVKIGSNETIGASLSDYAATWDGYAEAYAFPPGSSDHVHLVLQPNGQGTLQVGDGTLPPPTNPNMGYPPAMDVSFGLDAPGRLNLIAGFAYPLYAAKVQTNRIQLGILPLDLYAAWCALQTSYAGELYVDGGVFDHACVQTADGNPTNTSCYEIALDSGTSGPDGGAASVDCGKQFLCAVGVCNCTASGCAGRSLPASTPANLFPSEIDGALDATGSTLTGTLSIPSAGRVTVHLQKQ